MRPVTRGEMQRLDRTAIDQYAVASLLLMENAGRAVCEVIAREFPPGDVTVFIGKGNNGGDGFVVARHLLSLNFKVRIVLLEDPLALKPDPRINYLILEAMKVPVLLADERTPEEGFVAHCQQTQLIVDAIFGIGIQRPVQGRFEKAIRVINRSQKPVVSIDIPSGLDADTGQVHGAAVMATMTVALALPKVGFFCAAGPKHTGKVETVDIGIPRELMVDFLK